MKIVIVFLIVFTAMPAVAVHVETLIAPASEPLQAGREATIGIYIHNMGQEATAVALPDRVTCLVKSESTTVEVTAFAEEPLPGASATIAAMGFLKARYILLIPDNFFGPVRLEIPAFEGASVLLAVSAAPTSPAVM